VPALVIHCAMHSYRTAAIDDWREFLGVTSRRHTSSHRMTVKLSAGAHPSMAGFTPDWVTPVDELYVIDRLWPHATPLATAVSPEDQREYPLAWVNDYHGARVFGTTLGHGNATWADPVFQDLIVRGFRWALGR
jgi:type 1 glutamine amidotransferase